MKLEEAILPLKYDNYVFDLYGTLVDIHTEEGDRLLWEKLAMFYGYYGALYAADELQEDYGSLVKGKEKELKLTLEGDPRYAHEASPEIEITSVFEELFVKKGVTPTKELAVHAGQFFRVLSTDYVKVYPGTIKMLENLRQQGKKIYLLSNAQRIFTEYEMRVLDIFKYFDAVLISSDYQTKKPDKRFFDILIEQYQLKSDKTLFIGNDSRCDIDGAKQVDFATFYVNSNISPKKDKAENADYVVEEFTQWDIHA